MKIISLKEIQKRIINKYNTQDFEIIEYTKISKPFVIKCLKCGEIKNLVILTIFFGSKKNLFAISYKDFKKLEDIITKLVSSTTSSCNVGSSEPKE